MSSITINTPNKKSQINFFTNPQEPKNNAKKIAGAVAIALLAAVFIASAIYCANHSDVFSRHHTSLPDDHRVALACASAAISGITLLGAGIIKIDTIMKSRLEKEKQSEESSIPPREEN